MEGAAYVRFFNGISYYPNMPDEEPNDRYFPPAVKNKTISAFYGSDPPTGFFPATPAQMRPGPLVSFFIDPEMDDQGLPVAAKMTGDFIGIQQNFYPYQPDKVGDQERNIQVDWPGVLGLERAPVQGGVDLARWARVPAGKHRIVCVYRTLYNEDYQPIDYLVTRIPFFRLSQAQKSLPLKGTRMNTIVALDTVVELKSSESYTMKLVNNRMFDVQEIGSRFQSFDGGSVPPEKYHLLVRKENYAGQALQAGKLYLRVFNNTNSTSFLPDEFDVYHRIAWFTASSMTYDTLQGKWKPIRSGSQRPSSYTDFKKLGTVSGRFLSDAVNAPFYELERIPYDSLLAPNGIDLIYPKTILIDGTPVLPLNIAVNLIWSRHEISFYAKGSTPSMASTGLPAGVISPTLYLNLEPVLYEGGRYTTVPVLNTLDLNTAYTSWNSFVKATGNIPNVKACITQEIIR